MKKILLFLLCINIFIPYVSASVDMAYEYVLMNMYSGILLASKNMNSTKLIINITLNKGLLKYKTRKTNYTIDCYIF